MRNMSFSKTIQAFKEERKDVTRRLGWKYLKPGDHFMAVERGQGLKKGEKVVRMGECICISNDDEPLNGIIISPIRGYSAGPGILYVEPEVVREGFPGLTPEGFVEMFCKLNKCTPETPVQRIEFRRIKSCGERGGGKLCGRPFDL